LHETNLVLGLVAIVALGVAAVWAAWRTRVPAILLMSLAGLIAGPVLGLIDPSEDLGSLFQPVISLCVAVILFEGGLSLQLRDLKLAGMGVRRLTYFGPLLAWLLAGAAAHYLAGLGWAVSLVFGAIMVVTGPTVIIPMLRQAGLNRRTASYFKWEAIINDPMGALLAVLVFQFFVLSGGEPGFSPLAGGLGMALAAGILLGGLGGWLIGKAYILGHVPEYLKSPVMLTAVLVVFAVSNAVQDEAGLLAVTIMGMVVGNMNLPSIQDMKRFKEYISIMLVAVVFIMLTADLDIARFAALDYRGLLLVAAILFLTRPASVLISTIGSDVAWQDRILLAWIAPRGIVAAATAGVMAPRLAEQGFSGADALLPLVFVVIFSTITLHGLSINWLANRLGLADTSRNGILLVGASPWSIDFARTLHNLGVPVLLVDNSWHNLRAARLSGIKVFYGEILSEFAEESIELGRIGTVLTATNNDAYNALVCTALAPEVGRNQIFQLSMGEHTDADPRGVARSLRGRVAFDEDALFEKLWRLHVRGWSFYKTRITENYSYSDFLGDCPAEAMRLLVLDANEKVSLISPDAEPEPQAGDTLVYYGPERPADTKTDQRESANSDSASQS